MKIPSCWPCFHRQQQQKHCNRNFCCSFFFHLTWCSSSLKMLLGFSLLLVFLITFSSAEHFGCRTRYNTTAQSNWKRILLEDARLPPTCKLFHLRMVARHGTRSPDAKNIDSARKALRRLAEAGAYYPAATKEQMDLRSALLGWQSILPDGKRLLGRGREENHFLARDYFNLIEQFSDMLTKQSFAFNFHSTEIARSYDSGVAFRDEFVKSLLNGNYNITSTSSPYSYVANVSKSDDTLYFHKNCPSYVNRVEKSNVTSAETKRVRLTLQAVALVTKINRERLGLPDNTLEWNSIFALYQMAAFEAAALNGSSVFLPLFDDEDTELLEYADELDNYWKKAYGHQMIADLSCVLTIDTFETAQRKLSSPMAGFDGIFEFAHLETLLPVYAAFGLYHDTKQDFVANAPRSFIRSRQFKTSIIGPFAANIAFLFFVCPNSDSPHRVVFLVNGKVVPLSNACPASQVNCPLHLVRSAYSSTTPHCNLKDMCRLESGSRTSRVKGDDSSDELISSNSKDMALSSHHVSVTVMLPILATLLPLIFKFTCTRSFASWCC